MIYLAGSNFDSDKYIQLISRFNQEHFNGNLQSNFCLQQDNAPIHVSSTAKQYFNNNNIPILKWPPCSPDLNIVENCWFLIQKKIDQFLKRNIIRNEEQLFNKVVEYGQEISIDEINNLFKSLKRRVNSCKAKNGGSTGY